MLSAFRSSLISHIAPCETGHMTYHSNGNFTVHPLLKKDPDQQRSAKHFGMIAGGTGITPMLQVMHAVLRDEPNSNTTVSLIYANQTEDDILVREELEKCVEKYPGRFKLHYTLDRPPSDWKYSTGFITKEMIEKHLPKCAADGSAQILMCGPPPMVKFACIPNLEALGFKKKDYFVF
jgi:cytochrome-b5 reductase